MIKTDKLRQPDSLNHVPNITSVPLSKLNNKTLAENKI